jgi:hypothetical protein
MSTTNTGERWRLYILTSSKVYTEDYSNQNYALEDMRKVYERGYYRQEGTSNGSRYIDYIPLHMINGTTVMEMKV